MTQQQWNSFCNFRDQYKALCHQWANLAPLMAPVQRQLLHDVDAGCPFETSVVYNMALDDVTSQDEIKLIVIGDNPGKEEQLAKNNRYLVGSSGRNAEGFFRRNPELAIDFRRNAIIMNKTPIHTAKTRQLLEMAKKAGPDAERLLQESQRECARLVARLHQDLGPTAELWLVGHSELKPRGIFQEYKAVLTQSYGDSSDWNRVFVYNHFSMSSFISDYNKFHREHPDMSLKDSLVQIGTNRRLEVFGR